MPRHLRQRLGDILADEQRIRVHAPPDLVYRLAAEIEFWPAVSGEIRSARVLRRAPDGRPERLIEVRSRLSWLPVRWGWLPSRWRLVQRQEPQRGRISYRVLGGRRAGATTTWDIAAASDGAASDVSIVGRADQPFADALLRDLKRVAEGGSLSEA